MLHRTILAHPAKRIWLTLASSLILFFVLFASMNLASPYSSASTPLVIYDDSLVSGWSDASSNAQVNYSATNPVQSGRRSIGVTLKKAASTFRVRHAGLNITSVTKVQFYINGGSNGNQVISVYAEDSSGRSLPRVALNSYLNSTGLPANAWSYVEIPLVDLGLGSYPLTAFVLQNVQDTRQPVFYVDMLQLSGDSTTTATNTPTPTSTASPTASATPISQPTATATPTPSQTPADVQVSVNRSAVIGQSKLQVGTTYMQYTLDSWGDPAAVSRGKALLQQGITYHNQYLMGWGVDNPEPSPGVYNWASLDARINLIRSMGGVPVITLCAAPDWMKGGIAGQTDWSKLEVAPLPEHYGDFAELARQVALRYPDVKYFQVWSEMKGLWSNSLNNWDYVAYTSLYNQVYDALKSANPDIKVGGPYLVIEGTGTNTGEWWAQTPITGRQNQIIDYWLANMHGADFITLDRGVKDWHDTNTYSNAQLLTLTQNFGNIARQVLAKPKVQQLGLPLWWAEDAFVADQNWNFQSIGFASMLYNDVLAGVSVSLRWTAQAQPNALYGNEQNLFSDTMVAGGGQPFPAYYVYKNFHDYFGPGTALLQTTSSASDVQVLASGSKTMIINQRPVQITVSVNGTYVTVAGYGVIVIDTPA